jgi:hypothetical protein
MSIVTVFGGILLRHPKVKALIDKGLSDFIDGFVGKPPPTKEESIEVLQKFVEEMKRSKFPDAFNTREDYFAFLLTVITQAAHLREQPVVLPDLYVPKYHFYFPQPRGNPEVVSGNFNRIEAGTGRQVETPPNKPYRFYAVPAATNKGNPTINQLEAGTLVGPAGSDESKDWRTAIARAVGLSPDDILAIKFIGKAQSTGQIIFVAFEDPWGGSDLEVQKDPATRQSIVERLEEVLNTSGF